MKKSEFRGVTWCYSSKKWRARIYSGGKSTQLGMFVSEAEASDAYREAYLDALKNALKNSIL